MAESRNVGFFNFRQALKKLYFLLPGMNIAFETHTIRLIFDAR
jgi:hypothetical protein